MMKHCWLPDYTILMMAPGAESHQVKHSRERNIRILCGASSGTLARGLGRETAQCFEFLLPVNFAFMGIFYNPPQI